MQTPPSPTENRLITSEAVVLDVYPAEFTTRALARLIDTILLSIVQAIMVLAVILFMITTSTGEDFWWVYLVIILFLSFGIQFGYHIFFNRRNGTTPGKSALGIQILNRDGGPASLRQYFSREFVAIAEFQLTFGFPAIISSLHSPIGQRLGDLAANTIVVHTRPGPRYGTARAIQWQVPAGMEHFLPGMDLAGLTGEDITLIRSFLLRAPKMHTPSRAALAKDLRTLVVSRCDLHLPEDVPDETVLGAVMAKLTRPATLHGNIYATS